MRLAWMAIGLIACGLCLGVGWILFRCRTCHGLPSPRSNEVLRPVLALGLVLLICTLLDENLPEFGQ